MGDLARVWHFTRIRLAQAYEDLNDTQLNWRMFEGAHSIAEYLYHVAGVELYWAHHLGGYTPQNAFESCLLRCATESFLKEAPFPLSQAECTARRVKQTLDFTFALIRPIVEQPTEDILTKPVISPIGDPIDGREGLVRMAQHAGYHTGQIWLMRMHPEFPR